MERMSARLTEPIWHRYVPIVLLLIAFTALGSAYTAEFAYSLEPCVLCIYQRIPFAVIGVLGVLAYLLEGRMAMVVPVSYTHLTLPTILRV